MNKTFQILVIVFLSIIYFRAQAQVENILFDHITIEDGLSQSSIFAILQDRKGFLWFGTHDGLNRYDGYNFVVYKHIKDDSTSISGNIVKAIHEDEQGNIWVATLDNGLSMYNPTTEKFTTHPTHTLSTKRNATWYRALKADANNNIWAITEIGDVIIIDTKTKEKKLLSQITNDTLTNRNMCDLIIDSKQRCWIATNRGLNLYDPNTKKITHFYPDPHNPNSLANEYAINVYEDSKQNVWIATNNGLSRYIESTGNFKNYFQDKNNPFSLVNNTVQRIFEDATNKLWIGTIDGLNLLDPQTDQFRVFKHDPNNLQSLGNNNIATIYEDKAGIVWIGTWERGLSKYDRKSLKFRSYKHLSGIATTFPDRTVRSVMEDVDSTIWIGYVEGGLLHYDPRLNTFEYYKKDFTQQAFIHDNTVSALFRDSNNDLWVGTWTGGLHKAIYKNGKIVQFKHYTADSHGLLDNRISKVFEDSKHNYWIATESGLDLFDIKTEKATNVLNLVGRGSGQNAILEDKQGNVWAGTWVGLYKFTPKRSGEGFDQVIYTHQADKSESLPDNRIISLSIDSKGTLWAGTFSGGMIKIVHKADGSILCTSYSELQGLSNNVVYAIFADNNDKIWMSTNKGISFFDPATEMFTNYDASDGLQSNEFFWGAGYKSKNGQLYFGGIAGLNLFYPNEISNNKYNPPIVITDFKMFNTSVSIGSSSPLQKSIIQTDTIELSYKDKVISFEFSSLHFSVPGNNQYAYKLEGFNDRWIYTAADKRFATYTNLDAGKYVFRVKGSNSDGVWNEDGVSVIIIVHPPFWETWWFRTLVVLFITGTAFTWYRQRISRIQRQKEELESQVKERTLEVVQKNEALEQQKNEIEIQNEHIRGSIRYALKIQTAILPFKEIMDECFENFVIYRPKDIVSGDFYWFTREKPNTPDETIFIVVADCTGHGVPGAFMSMIGYSLLNEIVRVKDMYEPSQILEALNEGIIKGLQQEKTDNNDGMDVSLCRVTRKGDDIKIVFAGAKNPLYYIKSDSSELLLIDADRKSLGGYHSRKSNQSFNQSELILQKGDMIYLMSDGLIDQQNIERKRFGSLRFKQLIQNIAQKNIMDQQILVEKGIDDFKGNEQQRDDITIMGVRL